MISNYAFGNDYCYVPPEGFVADDHWTVEFEGPRYHNDALWIVTEREFKNTITHLFQVGDESVQVDHVSQYPKWNCETNDDLLKVDMKGFISWIPPEDSSIRAFEMVIECISTAPLRLGTYDEHEYRAQHFKFNGIFRNLKKTKEGFEFTTNAHPDSEHGAGCFTKNITYEKVGEEFIVKR